MTTAANKCPHSELSSATLQPSRSDGNPNQGQDQDGCGVGCASVQGQFKVGRVGATLLHFVDVRSEPPGRHGGHDFVALGKVVHRHRQGRVELLDKYRYR